MGKCCNARGVGDAGNYSVSLIRSGLMDVKTITPDGLFRLFTACPDDAKTFVLDVRPQKEFQKSHIMQSYCIRLAANGQALLVSTLFLHTE